MTRVHFAKFEFERHGLEAPPSCQHLLSILTGITFGGENLNGRLNYLGFWLRGNKRCW